MTRIKVGGEVVHITEWIDARATVRRTQMLKPSDFELGHVALITGVLASLPERPADAPPDWGGRLRLTSGTGRRLIDARCEELSEKTWMRRYLELLDRVKERQLSDLEIAEEELNNPLRNLDVPLRWSDAWVIELIDAPPGTSVQLHAVTERDVL